MIIPAFETSPVVVKDDADVANVLISKVNAVVASAVEDSNVVESSVVCFVLGIDVCFCVDVIPGVET